MRSEQLNLGNYNTDKIVSQYLKQYDPIFEPWVNKEVKLLELGVREGGSMLLWRDYFQQGIIVGVDIKLPRGFGTHERIKLFQGSQGDKKFLSEVANTVAPQGFDIIIDDASHVGELTKIGFWHLFENHLKPGGMFVIEDWGTGYWKDWPDGMSVGSSKSAFAEFWSGMLSRFAIARRVPVKIPYPCHSYGMVGFLKELVDEVGAADLTKGSCAGASTRLSKFESMTIVPAIAFIKKAADPA